MYITFFSELPLTTVCKQILAGVNSFTLLALPFFLFLGAMLSRSGLTERLLSMATALVGHMKGGLAQVNVVCSVFLAGVQGSASSDVAAEGALTIPAMMKDGYSGPYSAAVTGASACIGPMIPPSLTAVVIGSVASISIGRLFLGGIIPGVVIAVFLMIYCGIKARQDMRYCGSNAPFSFNRLFTSIKEGWTALFIPLIIVAGISAGFFTATESATFAVLVTIFLGVVVYRSLNWEGFKECIKEAVFTLGNITIIIASAAAFGWILTREGAVDFFQRILINFSKNPRILMLIVTLIYLIAGCFVETLALVILFVPIFLPIVVGAGYDTVQFGVVTIFALTIGTITPPLGVCMYLACDIAKISIEDFMKEMIPMYIPMLFALLVIVFFPPVSTFLPYLFMP
jgi:C4-dicarboxylate transporter DctM subunit